MSAVNTNNSPSPFFNTPSSPSSLSSSPAPLQPLPSLPPQSNSSLPQPSSTSSSSPSPTLYNNADRDSNDSSDHGPVSPAFIAIIVVVPVLLASLMLVYWRRKLFHRAHHYTHTIHQPDQASSPPGAPSRGVTLLLPPGGTGADRPEGQRRADRMRRLMHGINRRPSRSDSLRTVPEYSADPMETEMTLARAQRGAAAPDASTSQPSLLMRFIGQHTRAHHHGTSQPEPPTGALHALPIDPGPSDPPPLYESPRRAPTPSGSGTATSPRPPLRISLTSASSRTSAETHPARPQHHMIELGRTQTGTSMASSGAPSHKPPERSANFLLRPTSSTHSLFSPEPEPELGSGSTSEPPSPPPQVAPLAVAEERYRLPSSGPTPQQLRFLGSFQNLERLGVGLPTGDAPPAFEDGH